MCRWGLLIRSMPCPFKSQLLWPGLTLEWPYIGKKYIQRVGGRKKKTSLASYWNWEKFLLSSSCSSACFNLPTVKMISYLYRFFFFCRCYFKLYMLKVMKSQRPKRKRVCGPEHVRSGQETWPGGCAIPTQWDPFTTCYNGMQEASGGETRQGIHEGEERRPQQ